MPALIPIAIQVGAMMAGYTAVQAAVAAFVASVGVSVYQRSKAKKDARAAYNASLQDRTQLTAMADQARSRVYGRVRTADGVIFKGSWGDKRQNYTMVVALAGHEVDAIEQIYFNDVPVTVQGSIVTTAPWGVMERVVRQRDVLVTSSPMTVELDEDVLPGSVLMTYGDESTYVQASGRTLTLYARVGEPVGLTYAVLEQQSLARVFPFTGYPGQDLSPMLAERFGTMINASHRFAGIACVVVDFLYDTGVYASGPPAVTARVRGARVFDPRSNGTEWSDNPALCARDWALYAHGGGRSLDDLVTDAFVTAANVCDQLVTYSAIDGSTELRKRYLCGYVARTDQSPEVHFAELVEAMAGRHAWTGGRLTVRAGGWVPPVMTLTDDLLHGEGTRRVTDSLQSADLINVMRVSIANEAVAGAVVQLPELRAASFIAADGEELVQEDTFGAVVHAKQAYYVAAIRMRELRQGLQLQWPVTMRAFGLQVLDRVWVACPRYGWPESAPKAFDVLGVGMDVANNMMALQLKEAGASVYDLSTQFPVLDAEPNTLLPRPWDLPVVSGLQAVSGTAQLLVQADGSVLSRTLVQWSPVAHEAVLNGGAIEISYKAVRSTADWQAVQVPGDSRFHYLTGLTDGQEYLLRARVRSRIAVGRWSPYVLCRVLGKLEPPPVPDQFTVRAMPDGTRVLEGGYVAANRPVDLAGYRIRYRQGSGPFAWADMSPFQTDDGFITSLPLETNLLAAGTWSIALAGVDTSGNVSEPLMITGVLPNPRLGDALTYYSLEAVGWPGTLSDGERQVWAGKPVITAFDPTTWDDLTTWDAWTRWSHNPAVSWTYTLDVEDLGAVINTLPVVTLAGQGVFVSEEQHSVDGLTWTPWAPIAAAFLAQFVRIRVTVSASGATGPGVTQVTWLEQMQVVYTASVAAEVIEDLSPAAMAGPNRIGVGDIRLPLSSAYATVRVESVAIQSATGAWTFRVVDKSPTLGPRVQFLNGGVLADPPLIDATLKGIRL